jgi:PAS domain-containing protein
VAEDSGPLSEITVQALLDGIPASVVLVDQQGRIAAVNRNWVEFCTKNGGDLAAVSPPADYIAACAGATPTSTAREVVDGVTGVLHRTVDRFDFEYPCHGPDIERWFRMTVTAVPQGVLVMHQDISAEYPRVSRWLAATPIAIVELDPQANAVYVNAAWAALARRPTRQLLGRRWAEHLDPERSRLLLDAVHGAAHSGRHVTLDVWLPDHDRRLRMRFTVTPYQDDYGTLRRITLVGLDVAAGQDRGIQAATPPGQHSPTRDEPPVP